MAKNLFEQLLDLTGSIFSGPKIPHDTEAESKNTSGLSGVERYLEKQAKAAQEKAAAAAKQLTGVEKYLEKQSLAAKEKAAAAAAVTGVEKYLAKQGAVAKEKTVAPPVPVTGVDKYLAKKTVKGHETATELKQPAPVYKEPVTGVDKYMAKKTVKGHETAAELKQPAPVSKEPAAAPKESVTAAKDPVQVSEETPAPATKEAATATKKPAKETATATKKPVAAPKESAEETKPKTPHTLKLSENATQCQALTSKGTQCKNSTHLSHIHRTINKQQYEFAVCTQHHNLSFKPFPDLIENL